MAGQWTVREGLGDPLLSLLPLQGDVAKALAAELIRDGCAERCGECEKPFSTARKRRGIGRVVHVAPAGGGVFTTAWMLCGSCRAQMQRNGNRVSDKLIQEARSAAEAGITLMQSAGGRA